MRPGGRHTAPVPPIRAPYLSDGHVALRAMTTADIPAIVAACRDPEIPRWTSVPSSYSREDAERFLAVSTAEAAAGDGITLAVADADGELIGTVGLMGVSAGYAEIGYWVAARARRRGVATRAVRLLGDWAHAELGVTVLEILAHRDNESSQRVARAAGFAETGVIRSLPRMPPGRQGGYKVFRLRPRP